MKTENFCLFIEKKNGTYPRERSIKMKALRMQREVREETGIKKIKVGKLAGITYHIFKRNNCYQLKESHWFYMKSSYGGTLVPEFKEHITKATWKNKNKTVKAIKKTYPNIKDLFDQSNLMIALFGEE